jgi:ABC-type sugar transport system ATPase subunit
VQPILSMEGISKQFPGVKALSQVRLDLYKGEVHALMGENGAGKSTLMKILSGVYPPNEGTLAYKGKKITWSDPEESRKMGISIIHQELNVSPNLSIAENIFMGSDLPRNRFGLVKWKEVNSRAKIIMESIGCELDPETPVSRLSVAQQQLVEIARALSVQSEILVMDEPTAALTEKEISNLFSIIADLKKQGVAIVYISHRMDEIFQISDRCTVLRDGTWIATMTIQETSPEHLVNLMVGRELKNLFKRPSSVQRTVSPEQPVLELMNVTDRKTIKGVNLRIYPGEIVGLAGLVGAGRTELVQAIFGYSKIVSGEILIDGRNALIKSPIDAISHGIALVPENRKEHGLCLELSVRENIAMTTLGQYRSKGFIKWKQVDGAAESFIQQLDIKVSSPEQKVLNLSGGNQQKVVLSKWLNIKPKVLLLDEPTRGVDIGAKTEIHRIIYSLAQSGIGILLISSELPEILGVSDRILVMHEGRIKADMPLSEATQEKIMVYATGGIA